MTQENWGLWRGGAVKASAGAHVGQSAVWSLWQNDLYIVTTVPFYCDWGWCTHLVARVKPEALPLTGLTWSSKQRIKNELVGVNRLAVEVFPPDAELVDQADAYHLWVLPEGFRLPFTVEEVVGT